MSHVASHTNFVARVHRVSCGFAQLRFVTSLWYQEDAKIEFAAIVKDHGWIIGAKALSKAASDKDDDEVPAGQPDSSSDEGDVVPASPNASPLQD